MSYAVGLNQIHGNQWQTANTQKSKTAQKETSQGGENGQIMQGFMATTGINNQPAGINQANSASGPPPEILSQLQQYGLQPTGSLEGDLAAINKAKQTQESKQNPEKGKAKGNSGNKKPPPPSGGGQQYDANLKAALNSLGITESDSKESDYAKAMQHFSKLTDNAGTDISQKQYISSLKQAFISVYNAAA
jgi:hypothetical protein